MNVGATLTNQGTIIVSGGDTLFLAGSLANAGTLIVGAGGALDIDGGSVSNTGSVRFAGGVLELTGTLSAAQLQADALLGAPIVLNGEIDNTGGTIAVGAGQPISALTLGPSGVIRNGTVFDKGGLIAAGGTLDGVAYQGTGLTVASGQLLSVADGITLTGTTGAAPGLLVVGSNADVLFDNTQTLDNAVVQLGGTLVAGATPGAFTFPGNGTLALGTGLTIQATGPGATLSGQFANAGSIVASGGGILLNVGTLAHTGSVAVANGAVLDLGALTSAGRISETNATLNLDGPISLPALNTITRNGGIVALSSSGALALGGGVLNVGSGTTLGQLRDNGAISGGTIHDTGGGMVFYGGLGSLQNVTYQGLLNLTPAGSYLDVLGGLTLTGAGGAGAGQVNLLGAGSRLTFQGSQTFNNATINLGSNDETTTLSVSDPTGLGAVLTLGAGASLQQRGAMAQIDIDRGLGDALVNDGLIAANDPNGHMIVLGGTFANAGRVVVSSGDTLSLEADQVANLTGNILNTGYWEVDANSTLNLGFDNPILNMNAAMVLNGAGSQVLYYNTTTYQTTSLEQTLHYVGTAGVLVLENGRAFNDPGLFFDSGQVVLSGGTLSGNPVAIGSTGLIYGAGTITAGAIYDSGHVLANGGALVLNAPLLGGAPVGNALIAAGSTLVAEQTLAVPVQFLANTGTLALAQANLMYGTIFSFTGSDAIDMLNVNPSGVALSYAPGSGNGVLTVKTGTVTDATLHFNGAYVLGNFSVTSDGHGGTLLLDPPVPMPAPTLTGADWKVTLGDLAPPPPAGAISGVVANAGTHAVGFGMATPQDPPSSTLLAHQ